MTILRRLPESRFSEVLPAWSGQTVVILGGGPSLTREHLVAVCEARMRDEIKVVAINDLYLLASYADLHYAADSHWHAWHTNGIAKPKLGLSARDVAAHWRAFKGQKSTIQNSGANVADDAVHMLKNRSHPHNGLGISLLTDTISGRNSGMHGLNITALAGADTIILCGFDAREPTTGVDAHGLCGDHPRPTPQEAYELYRRDMSAAENDLATLGVRVLNASKISALNNFERIDIVAFLAPRAPCAIDAAFRAAL